MAWLIWSFVAFTAAVLSQAALLRFFRVRHGIVAFVGAGVPIGLVLMVVLLLNWPSERAISGTLLYAFLCELWMFILSVTFSSVAATLMMYLRLRPISLEEVNRIFDDHVMIRNRIGWLTRIGAAVRLDNQLTPTGSGEMLARLFDVFRSFFGHR